MPQFRTFSLGQGTELSQASSGVIPASGVGSLAAIAPTKAGGRPIIRMKVKISATATFSTAPASSPGTVGQLINELKIFKGSTPLVDAFGINQLTRIAHIVSGETLTDTAFGSGSTSLTAADEFEIPFQFTTSVVPSIILNINPQSTFTNCNGGTVSLTVGFVYGSAAMKLSDDKFYVIPALANQPTGVDVQISSQFNVQNPVKEVWIDVAADANFSYSKFVNGNNVVYDQVDVSQITASEQGPGGDVYSHIAGFLYVPQQPGTVVYQALGSVATLFQELVSFATSITPTYYLWVVA